MNEVRIKEHDEVYTWTRPSTYVKNIMSGEKYLEHVGVMEVHNEDTGERAAITFKEGSSWGGTSSRNKVEGKVFDTHDTAKIEVCGKHYPYINDCTLTDTAYLCLDTGQMGRIDCTEHRRQKLGDCVADSRLSRKCSEILWFL